VSLARQGGGIIYSLQTSSWRTSPVKWLTRPGWGAQHLGDTDGPKATDPDIPSGPEDSLRRGRSARPLRASDPRCAKRFVVDEVRELLTRHL
jgi:hypothetical protein